MAQEIRKSETGAAPAHRYFDPFSAMRAEMDRVFESFLGRGSGRLRALARAEENGAVVPSIDVRETKTELVIEAELPGLDEKDVSVTLNNGILTLKGEKKSEREEKKDDYHLMERSYGPEIVPGRRHHRCRQNQSNFRKGRSQGRAAEAAGGCEG